MTEKRNPVITVAVIGAMATIIAALIGLYSSMNSGDKNVAINNYEHERKQRAQLIAEIRENIDVSQARSHNTISGLSHYDDSYICAAIDAIRNIAEIIGGVHLKSSSEVESGKLIKDVIVTNNVANFGKTLRLSFKTVVDNAMLIEDIMRLDVYPNPIENPSKSYTIIINNYIIESISRDFSVKDFDFTLKKEGFEMKAPIIHEDGSLEITCLYIKPGDNVRNSIKTKGFGLSSDIRSEQ